MFRMTTLLILLTLALVGCPEQAMQCDGLIVGNTCYPDSNECISDQECLPAGVCLNGTCGAECTSDLGCLNGYRCETYRCVPVTGPREDTVTPPEDTLNDTDEPIPCQGHVDCDPYELACINGFCGKECTEDWHCDDPALVCQHFLCVPAGGPGEDTVEPPEDVGDCPPKNGAYGDLCACKEQCATQLCVQNFLTGQNTCTQYCTGDLNCPGTDICVALPEENGQNVSICYYNDAGVTPPSCVPEQSGCFKGMVVSNKLGQCACTVPCIDAATSCPAGMACHVDDVAQAKYCVAVGGACTAAQNPCFSQNCVGSTDTGYCTALCLTNADCPTGWSCLEVVGGNACVAP